MIDQEHATEQFQAEPPDINSRRVRLILVDERTVLSLFQQRDDILSLPVFPELPKGYEIRAVYYDLNYLAFAFLVYHIEFSPVELGAETPRTPGVISYRQNYSKT